MENPRNNPNFSGDGRSFDGRSSSSFRSLLDLEPDLVAQYDLEREQMNQPQRGQRQRAGISSPDSSEHNHSVNNQRATEPGTEPLRQPAHASSSGGSLSKGENDPEITAAEKQKLAGKKTKAEVDRNYRERRKRKLEQVNIFVPENKRLHDENAFLKAQLYEHIERLAEEKKKADDLTERLAEAEKKEKKELYAVREKERKDDRERIKQLKSDLKTNHLEAVIHSIKREEGQQGKFPPN